MAVELRNRIEAGLNCNVRATLLFDYPTLEVSVPYLLDEVLRLGGVVPAAGVDGAVDSGAAALVEAVGQLSADELLSFIEQKFEEKG